jgi:16S rRNA (guanine527-N7)-methyltransferase
MAHVPSPALHRVLERAHRLGVLGPGPVQDHVAHAERFVTALADLPSGSLVVDLGSGAGIPGLVVAEARPDLRVSLLESLERRAALLTEGVGELGWTGRVSVLHDRAEEVGRHPDWRGRVDAVTSRSFGPPATTAECAAPLLCVGGLLVVSEPPHGSSRWPAEGLAALGMEVAEAAGRVQVLRQVEACPDDFPRRVGLPAKRPLF